MDDERIGGEACDTDGMKARPDFMWCFNGRAVIVEIDENAHESYPVTCELARMWNIVASIKQLCGENATVFFLRFNPDSVTDIPLEERVARVGAMVRKIFAQQIPGEQIGAPNVMYFFYEDGFMHVNAAKRHPESIVVLNA